MGDHRRIYNAAFAEGRLVSRDRGARMQLGLRGAIYTRRARCLLFIA